MSEPAIRVENLGKKYRIHHQQEARRYKALRDVLADVPRRLWSKIARASSSGGASATEDFWALREAAFEIPQGEAVGIIGRNGAGKSTLLKLLSRITAPTTGRIEIVGRIASLLEVGTGFHPELTGRENIYLNGAILGLARAEIKKRFDEIVSFAEVDKFLDTPVKRYSSGMYMRLAFAVAAHLEPEILVVDEVLAVGDAAFQKKCLCRMSQVSTQGRTVLFVSHNMSAIRSLCQKALLLAGGKIIHTGPVNTVVDAYLANLQAAASLEINFSGVPRAGHFGSRLKILQLRINDGKGIWHGQPLKVEFTFECLENVEGASFGIGFSNRDGVRILSMDSDIPGARWSFKRAQRGTVRLGISQLLLEPDVYMLDIGSRSGDNAGLEYLPQCGQVTVLPSETTPPVIAMRESGRGGVRLPAQWELHLSDTILQPEFRHEL